MEFSKKHRRGWRRDVTLKTIVESNSIREQSLNPNSSPFLFKPKIDLKLFERMVTAEEFLDKMGLNIVEPCNHKKIHIIIETNEEGRPRNVTTSNEPRMELKSPTASSLWNRRKKSMPQKSIGKT